MTLHLEHARAAATRWRTEAAKLRAHYRGMGDLERQGASMAMALEACADELEALLRGEAPASAPSAPPLNPQPSTPLEPSR